MISKSDSIAPAEASGPQNDKSTGFTPTPKFGVSLRSKRGFSLIELTVVVGISAILATIILVNFQSLRTQQEVTAAGNDLTSKIREVQNFVLSGKIINGTDAADAYEIRFTYPATIYAIYHEVDLVQNLLETVDLPQNMQVGQLTVGAGPPDPSVVVRITAPFAQILIEGASNQNLQIRLDHQKVSRTRTIIIDGISGRVGVQ